MTLIELIASKMDEFPKAEKRVAQLFLEHLDYVERLTITKIAQASQTSTSAVLRFCKTLGFQGFKDFRYAAINFLRTEIRDTENNQFSHNLQSYQQGLNALQSIPEDHIQDLLSALANANYIFAIGLYQSSLPAKLFHYGLLNLDKHSFFAGDILDINHLTHLIDEEDVLLYFSISGDKTNFERTLGEISENMPQNAYLFTNNHSAPIAPYFKTTFLLPDKTFSNNTVIDSQAYPVILTEIILNMLHHYPKP